MFWYFFIAVILLTLLWILLAPVIIFLNTREDRYFITLPGIFKASVVPRMTVVYHQGLGFFHPLPLYILLEEREESDGSQRKNPPEKSAHFKLRNEGWILGRNICTPFGSGSFTWI